MMKNTDNNGNVILIGMPGSGKSRIGRELHNRLQRELLDTDKMEYMPPDVAVPNTGKDNIFE